MEILRARQLAGRSYCPDHPNNSVVVQWVDRADPDGFAPQCPRNAIDELMVRGSQFQEWYAAWRSGGFRPLDGSMQGFMFYRALYVRARKQPEKWGFEQDDQGTIYRIGTLFAPWYNHGLTQEGLIAMTTQALVTEENVKNKVELARFIDKDVDERSLSVLAQAAVLYQLDPILNEITLYEGRPYVTAEGWDGKINAQPDYDGQSDPRVLTRDELIVRRMFCCDKALAIGVRVFRKGRRHNPEAIGKACPVHPYRSNPVEQKDPFNMAWKRARVKCYKVSFRDALRRIGLTDIPTFEDLPDDSLADLQTGEIIEGDFIAKEAALDEDFGSSDTTPTLDPLLVMCSEHGVPWAQNEYGWQHATEQRYPADHEKAGRIMYCGRRSLLTRMMREAREAANISEGEARVWCKEAFDKPPSALSDEERLLAYHHWVEVLTGPDVDEGEPEHEVEEAAPRQGELV